MNGMSDDLAARPDDDLAARVQAALDGMVAGQGDEVGLQVAVVHRGEVVVDAVAGVVGPAGVAGAADARPAGVPVAPDTLFFAASTAKGIASAVVHVLVERGELGPAGYDLPLVDVWPEFGAHGKAATTLRHVLLHTAGVPALPPGTTVADLADLEALAAALAAAPPWWPPGTGFGYHALTFGLLLGETVRRATGRPLPWWLRELVTGPLGVEDEVHFGVPPALLGRVAHPEPPVDPAGEPGPAPGSPADRALPPALRPTAELAGDPAYLTADLLSHGTMSARGAARVYAALLGDVPGVPLVSPERRRLMAAVAVEAPDEVMGVPSSWTFGFSPFRPGAPAGAGGSAGVGAGSTFGMVGANGSAAFADIDTGVAVAVMRNRFGGGLATLTEVDRLVAAEITPDP
jgi:CubicO group peptidase (beta-lactamase class C family)